MSEEIHEIQARHAEENGKSDYGAKDIRVLEGLEAVRLRPGMYIGSTSARGLHHLVYEVVDNSIDEALAGYCTHIEVTLNDDGSCTVTDNGRGIPTGMHETGKPAMEVVLTVLHAGGKFGGDGYPISGGLHGVGASVVNALSQWLEVQVQKDGKIYEMKFSRGGITQEMTVLGETTGTGTAVTFKPDPEMFDTLVYDYETLHTRMREQAFLNAGLRITITDARPGQEQSDSMCYEGGIREFVTWLNRNKTPLHEEVIYLAGAKGDSTAEVSLQYNDSYNETLVSFANDIHTPEGGMHETGFKTALTRVLNAYGMKYGMIKEGDKVSGEDVREGITAVISVKLTEAQFEGQTKAKLGNASIRTLVDNVVSDQLAVYLEEHPVVARTILDKAMTANRAREAARKARCYDFVMALPDGFDTVIGEGGASLSGGERQRISIARALLKDAPVVLLDEATASLDVENETAIQEALSRLIRNKTVLIIAHRMRTVAGADKVVVLKDGIVAEQGRPDELYARNGLYAHMVDLQSASQNWTI